MIKKLELEDAIGVLNNIERLLPRLEDDEDIKVAVLILIDRMREIIASL